MKSNKRKVNEVISETNHFMQLIVLPRTINSGKYEKRNKSDVI